MYRYNYIYITNNHSGNQEVCPPPLPQVLPQEMRHLFLKRVVWRDKVTVELADKS
jgi:hypothetical protein